MQFLKQLLELGGTRLSSPNCDWKNRTGLY